MNINIKQQIEIELIEFFRGKNLEGIDMKLIHDFRMVMRWEMMQGRDIAEMRRRYAGIFQEESGNEDQVQEPPILESLMSQYVESARGSFEEVYNKYQKLEDIMDPYIVNLIEEQLIEQGYKEGLKSIDYPSSCKAKLNMTLGGKKYKEDTIENLTNRIGRKITGQKDQYALGLECMLRVQQGKSYTEVLHKMMDEYNDIEHYEKIMPENLTPRLIKEFITQLVDPRKQMKWPEIVAQFEAMKCVLEEKVPFCYDNTWYRDSLKNILQRVSRRYLSGSQLYLLAKQYVIDRANGVSHQDALDSMKNAYHQKIQYKPVRIDSITEGFAKNLITEFTQSFLNQQSIAWVEIVAQFNKIPFSCDLRMEWYDGVDYYTISFKSLTQKISRQYLGYTHHQAARHYLINIADGVQKPQAIRTMREFKAQSKSTKLILQPQNHYTHGGSLYLPSQS